MNIEIALSLTGFAFAALFAPGPNNLLLMSSGLAHGWHSSLPHIVGSVLGVACMLVVAILGLSQITIMFPIIETVMKTGGILWLLWLSFTFLKPANERASEHKNNIRTQKRPFRLYEAVAFQWINPSALVITISIASAYAGIASSTSVRIILICSIFSIIALLATITWTLIGQRLALLFTSERTGLHANRFIGVLFLFSAVMIFKA